MIPNLLAALEYNHNNYLLEDENEFERLEDQALKAGYRPSEDLGDLQIPTGSLVLDAGCGSGVGARYLAGVYPDIKIIACDKSKRRIEQASAYATQPHNIALYKNVVFTVENLCFLSFPANYFDFVCVRHVFHHFPKTEARVTALRELLRVLKPGGQIRITEPASIFYDISHKTTGVASYFDEIKKSELLDLEVGKRLPELVLSAGFVSADWQLGLITDRSSLLQQERDLMKFRLRQVREPISKQISGGTERFDKFCDEFLIILQSPATVYYSVKVTVNARKENS